MFKELFQANERRFDGALQLQPAGIQFQVHAVALMLCRSDTRVILSRWSLNGVCDCSANADDRLNVAAAPKVTTAVLRMEQGKALVAASLSELARHHGSYGVLARSWPTGSMVIWVAVMLGLSLALYYA